MATEFTPPPKPSPGLSSANPATPPVDVTLLSASTPTPPTPVATPRLPEPDVDVIHIPSYSRWFSWNAVHECEAKFVPEFFNGTSSSSRNPRAYKYYRNAIIRRFRENPNRKITFTEVRKTIVGDVGSIRRLFDFLEAWGLINYAGSTKPQLRWEEKETKLAAAAVAQGSDNAAAGGGGADASVAKKRICSICKTPCTIACFASEKNDTTLCARCYVRNNYRASLSSGEFKRIEIGEEGKTDWTDKETLQLLEATMHYGDDWKKVAEHVNGRSVKECVAQFIKLPFGEQFDGPPESAEVDTELGLQNVAIPNKRMCLSPLADASNPIMAQAAFLSTMVGVDVTEAAARAAVSALSDLGDMKEKESNNALDGVNKSNLIEDAKLQLVKEEEDLEKSISGIATQAKEIEEKIIQFEDFDLEVERRRREFQQLQNRLFVDQLTLMFHKTSAQKTGVHISEATKIE